MIVIRVFFLPEGERERIGELQETETLLSFGCSGKHAVFTDISRNLKMCHEFYLYCTFDASNVQ